VEVRNNVEEIKLNIFIIVIITTTMSKYVLFPIKNDEVWSFYKKHIASFWVVDEIDLSEDLKDWNILHKKEQHFIKYILAFFAASDGIVNENISLNFINEVDSQEAKCFYGFQTMIENIHSETYSLLIDTYIKDTKEKNKLLNAVENIPCIKQKADWCFKYMNNDAPFIQRLVAFACVEGIFFSGAFCSIYWLNKRGLMKGLSFSNKLISRDEGLHTDFACLLYKQSKDKLSQEKIEEIVKEAVEHEKVFISDALPWKLKGMNSTLMKEYIEFVADHLVYSLGHSKIYNTPNPFEWMESISLEDKGNFFETRIAEYQKANLEDFTFNMNVDF
jgi:ribonucleotide reductase beta subunit family protein with ferritin-like domain